LVHGKTAYLAAIAQEVRMKEAIVGDESGYEPRHRVVFKRPRTVDYRASIHDIANYLMDLMDDPGLRAKMGKAGRQHVVENFDYRVVARRFLTLVSERLGIS
ncbi:MAG: glycosyltransferase, partial [Planctomycetota bacterium]